MRDLTEPSPVTQAAFEAMIRRYLTKVAGRYVPVLAIAVAVALVLIFVPTKQNNSGLVGTNGFNSGTGYSASGPTGSSSGASQSVQGSQAATGGGGTSVGTSGAGGGGGSTGTGSAVASGGAGGGSFTPVQSASPNLSGTAKTGVKCGNSARQFPWSAYAPYCVPAFTGNNGGATAPGVTAKTITLTYRLANSAQQSAIDSLAGAANINQNDLVADMQSYVNYFNTQFELYGRKVVLKPYQGQGDYIEEDQGQGLAATQADAVTAHDMGSFGDVTFALTSSQYYTQDLAAQHVISFSSIGMSQQWFQQYAPYEYSVQSASGTNSTQATTDIICARMANLPAIFAGSPLMTKTKRVFGVIFPQTPVYQAEVNQWEVGLAKQCGVHIAKTIGYSINVADYEAESASAMAQLNAAHVTTILCACDPIADIFLSQAADNQQYYPEWVASYFGDPIGRNYDQKEWDHVITGGFQWPHYDQVEPYKVFEQAYPGKQPAEVPPSSPRYYYVPYYTLMQVFDALQAAGPDLNPNTFEQGMFSLPASAPGDYIGGQWKFGPGVFDPITSYSLAWWNPNAVSEFDNTKGAYQWCNAGQSYTLANPAALGPPGRQLNCFGK
jgi:hypothetical protein